MARRRAPTARTPTTVLAKFLVWLMETEGLAQAHIARRTGHRSQAAISKIVLGSGTQDSKPETYRAIVSAFPHRWQEFLRENEPVRRQLEDQYAWAIGHFPRSKVQGG